MDIRLKSKILKFSLIPDQAAGVALERDMLVERELRHGEPANIPTACPSLPVPLIVSGSARAGGAGPEQVRTIAAQLRIGSFCALSEHVQQIICAANLNASV